MVDTVAIGARGDHRDAGLRSEEGMAMRMGLIGGGRTGLVHARTLRGIEQVGSTVIADVDPARAREVAAEVGASAVGSVAELFAAGIDPVVIAAPTPYHATLIRSALAA